MEIQITNFVLLKTRVGYVQAMAEYEQSRDKDYETPTHIKIETCTFAPDNAIITIFEAIQSETMDQRLLKTIHFTYLIMFAEVFMADILADYVAREFFTNSTSMAARSVLWVVQHHHFFSPSNNTKYLNETVTTFGTKLENLRYCNIERTWLINYNNLVKHLATARKDKQRMESINFSRTCARCKQVEYFDGRSISPDAKLRGGTTWICLECNKCEHCEGKS
jgi:hypothetical protein